MFLIPGGFEGIYNLFDMMLMFWCTNSIVLISRFEYCELFRYATERIF